MPLARRGGRDAHATFGIPCLNFADARVNALRLAVTHEQFNVSHHPSSYRNCRGGTTRN